ncbi:MAG: FAD-binding oxidoreductase [Actinobacteria bacterium]|nr:FAD-binding oxidoreductase [Actinomycetota bacterium]
MNASAVTDLVVVGGGTLGGWASYFAKTGGAERVVVLERGLLGQGASSRAAGIVRSQGGTPATVALGQWSIDFYNRQQELLGTDSGFSELGYLLLAITPEDEAEGRRRVEMQRSCGLDVEWLLAETATEVCSTLAPREHRGGSYVVTDGAINPPRNVLAYAIAMSRSGVEVLERTAFTGLRTAASSDGSVRVTGVETSAGLIETERVIITGGPSLQAVGRLAGARIPVGGARHQVAVTEPHVAFQTGRQPMVFDLGAGLYWRLEEDGLLFGMSNPDESPGQATEIDWPYLEKMQRRLARLVPATNGLKLRKVWAATIDYTPDHLPILGPVLTAAGTPIEGTTVACAGGHGMMWGPAVARAAADLALEGKTDLIDVTELGLDRFDERGRSKLATDPIALPFPVST